MKPGKARYELRSIESFNQVEYNPLCPALFKLRKEEKDAFEYHALVSPDG